MKRYIIIPVLLALLVSSCDDRSKVLVNHDDPRISIPQKGFNFNTVWMLEGNEYVINYGVYLSGIRPESQKSNINVTFSIKPSLIADYNAGLNTYSGQVQELPANCYVIEGTSVTIPSGSNSGTIPIKIKTDLYDALPKDDGLGSPIYYAIPISLESVSKYALVEDITRRQALCAIQLKTPTFYFWDNRNGLATISRRVVYGQTPLTENFKVTSEGLDNDEAYTLTFAVDPTQVPSGQTLLDPSAYELPSSTVEIPVGKFDAFFPVRILNSNIPFRQTYYLPVRITATSKYSADPVKGVLLLKVEVKNDYEWSYSTLVASLLTQTGRAANYTGTKAPLTYDAETIRLQMSVNNTNANNSDANFLPVTGWTSAGWTGDPVAGFTHVAGNTNVLSHPNTASVGFGYTVAYTISGGTTGTFVIAFGGSTTAAVSASGTLTVTSATAATNLTVTPTSTCNRTIKVTITALNSFNNRFYRLKVTPNVANNRDWGVELIRITDEGASNSPVDLELNPDKHSYYDWDYEKFYLYYRWKNASGYWIEVTEILEATF